MKKRNPIRSTILAVSLLLQLSTLCFHSRGAAGDVDLSFDPGSGVTNSVSVVVVQPDGKVLIGGPLTFINGTNRYGSARLNADGSLDSTFISDRFYPDWTHLLLRPSGYAEGYAEVAAVAVQADGKVLVGGLIALLCSEWEEGCQSLFASFVTRLNPNGSHDTSFTPFLGAYQLSVVYVQQLQTVALQPDGKVVVGYAAGYGAVHGIVRLNANGTRDTNFTTSLVYPSDVYSVVPQADGKLLIGGSFNTVNGTNRNWNGVARLNSNGSLDNTFDPAVGGFPIALQPDGKVLVGGYARLNADGSLDSSFNPGTAAYGAVRSITLQADGKVLVGGGFTTIKGVPRQYVARLYGDSVAPSLNIARSNAFVIVSWPVSGLNSHLEENTNPSIANSWSTVPQTTVTNGSRVLVTIPASGAPKFFRLNSQ